MSNVKKYQLLHNCYSQSYSRWCSEDGLKNIQMLQTKQTPAAAMSRVRRYCCLNIPTCDPNVMILTVILFNDECHRFHVRRISYSILLVWNHFYTSKNLTVLSQQVLQKCAHIWTCMTKIEDVSGIFSMIYVLMEYTESIFDPYMALINRTQNMHQNQCVFSRESQRYAIIIYQHSPLLFDNSSKCVICLTDCFEDLWCQSFAGVVRPEEPCRTKCPVSSILGTFVPCMQRAPPVDLSALQGKSACCMCDCFTTSTSS